MSVKIKIRNKTGTDVWFRVYYPGDLPGLYDLQESIVPASYTQVFIKLPKGGVKMEWMPNWEDAEPGDDDDFKPFQTMEFERPMKKQTTFLFSMKKKKAVRGTAALKKKENAKRWQERKKAKNEEKSRIFSPASHAQVEESKSSRDAIRKMAGGGRLRRKSRPSKKTGTTTRKKKKKTTASSPNRETKHAAALSLLEQRIARQAAEAEKYAKRTEEAKAIGLAAAERRKREEEEKKISFPVDANASTPDQGEDSPVVLPEWVKQKCLQMGDSSLSMASRFLAEGKSSSSGTSVSSSVRAAARRSLGRRSSNGTTPPDVSPATLDELVGARRATIRPAIAAAAHRGSRHRAIARQEMSEATSVSPSASESPRLLESMSGSSDDVLSQGFTAGVPPRRAVAAAAAFSSAADGAIASRRATGHANVDSNVTRLSPLKRASFRANSPLKLPKATSRAQRDRMYSVAPASARSLLKALFSEVSGGEKKNAEEESEKDDSSIVIADVKAAEARRREALVAAAKEARALIETKGLRLWKDASNYDRKKGKLLHVGSVKAAASLKKYPGIICLFKREGAHAYSVKALTEEVEMQRKIASFGVRTALALTDPFEFKVDGTKTFGYLAEQIYTTMGEPYKPQAHKTTWCAMGACLRQLSNEQLDRATTSAQVIGVFNKFNHFLHDMQLLLQNCSPCDDQNGFIYVIDPGSLMPPRKSGGNQTYRLQRFLRRIRNERKGS